MVDKLHLDQNIFLTKHIALWSMFSEREQSTYFIDLFDKLLPTKAKVYIACSGGPDSMFLTYLLIWYRHIVKGLPVSITNILHINHNTSHSDLVLEKCVTENFGGFFHLSTHTLEKKHQTETILRKKRRAFYHACIQKNTTLQDVYLCLGHNLDDRIENSFLHFDRGTHSQGIVNMQQLQKKHIFHGTSIQTYICFRPLLSFPKQTITYRCDTFGIPYHHDIHNTDMTQKRIYYRKRIQQLSFADQQCFYEEWKRVYDYLQKTPPPVVTLKPVEYPTFWSIEGLYITTPPSTLEHLVVLLTTLGMFSNMSTVRLHEMMKWFHKKQGARYIGDRRFLFASGKLFVARQQKKQIFRESYQQKHFLIEKVNERYTIDCYRWYIDKQELLGAEITFPEQGDRKGSISYLQRAAKQHIPFFWRRSLPIIKKNGTIQVVLPLDSRPWNL